MMISSRSARERRPVPLPLITPVVGLGGALGVVVMGYYILRG